MINDFIYKGFRIREGDDVWYITNWENTEWSVGELVAELEKDFWRTPSDVKQYIDSFLFGDF